MHCRLEETIVMPLKWMSSVPWIGEKDLDTHLYYTPSTINASINYNEQLSQRTPRKEKNLMIIILV